MDNENSGRYKTKFTVDQVIGAIKDSAGIISTIAKRLGCSWHTVPVYIGRHPTIAKAYQAEREKVLDIAEGNLIKAIQSGDLQAIRYYLSTQGKRRGYVERVQSQTVTQDDIDKEIENELARLAGHGQGKIPGTSEFNPDAGSVDLDASPADAAPGASQIH